MNYRCKICKRKSTKSIDGLIEKFPRMYQFCNGDLNKYVLLLRKGVSPYEYMDSWKRFDEISLTDEKAFYSQLNLEDITDKHYWHAQKVFKEMCIYSSEYHDLYVQSDTLLLPNILEKFRSKCLEIYGLDVVYCVCTRIRMASLLKKERSKVRIINRL